ncbi:MAG: flagellin [Verrucomicrobiae bacterium]|nr:flagellin [Verrucomicrobiae bacterium]
MAVIGTNPSALNAAFYLNVADTQLSKSIKRLSSGSKLADPADDAAGVAVSSKLDATVKRLGAASEGAQNLISFAQTADGFAKTIMDQLTRMSELAMRASNGAFSTSDRANYQSEFSKLQTNINTQISNAKFNGTSVFGSSTVTATVSADASIVYNFTLKDMSSAVSNVTGISISDLSGATAAISMLSTALSNVASNRADMLADISSLTFYVQNLSTEKINTETANSRIKDLDFADESTNLAKYNILVQSATAMLAQANAQPQQSLALLQ